MSTIKSNQPIKNIIMSFSLVFTQIHPTINYFCLESVFFSIFGTKEIRLDLRQQPKFPHWFFYPRRLLLFYFCYFYFILGSNPKIRLRHTARIHSDSRDSAQWNGHVLYCLCNIYCNSSWVKQCFFREIRDNIVSVMLHLK